MCEIQDSPSLQHVLHVVHVYFMCMRVCLHVMDICMCTMYMQCTRRPEEGAGSLGRDFQVVASCYEF